ncbi:MAG TPA: retron system putative HNH endonuclease, partial [Polyangiaceae bacterium]|nr:retron system putative HNH endonuclease [Polyangiaceae bacterium]
KDELREALLREQRALCCYCMSEISAAAGSMKIEHWQCQSRYPDRDLVYENILGACFGGDGQPEDRQHCDTRKGNQDLKWNPAIARHNVGKRVRFDLDGTIGSDDSEFNEQLDQVLGLNLPTLMNRRKGVLDGLLWWWRLYRRDHHRRPPKDAVERQRNRWSRSDGGTLLAFAPVAVWWLERQMGLTE